MVVSKEKHTARYGTEEERLALAARKELTPELLFFLGTDPSERVRLEVVNNPSSPPHILRILARDDQVAVREAIAHRMRDLLQGVAPVVTDRLARIVESTLGYLVKDAVASVRIALAKAIADLPQASRDAILALARDTEFEVADPIIRLSPILEDQDLLDLIAFPAAEFTRISVARRPAISEKVADTISSTGDVHAIQALLRNESARISPETLEDIATRSRDTSVWQEALATRSQVPERVLRILASFIADDYALLLAERADLPAELQNALRTRLVHHATRQAYPPSRDDWTPDRAPVEVEARFLLLLGDNKTSEAIHMLAELLPVSPDTVRRILTNGDPEDIVTMAWSVGFGMRSATIIQDRLTKLPPERRLMRGLGQEWPIDLDRMREIRRRLLADG